MINCTLTSETCDEEVVGFMHTGSAFVEASQVELLDAIVTAGVTYIFCALVVTFFLLP
jgi:hypothetical protein